MNPSLGVSNKDSWLMQNLFARSKELTLEPWNLGTLEPWHLGTLAPWDDHVYTEGSNVTGLILSLKEQIISNASAA